MKPPAPAVRMVRCPACGGPSPYAPENRYRPFCSARCRLHDLGDWANERFRIDAQDGLDADATDPDLRHPPAQR